VAAVVTVRENPLQRERERTTSMKTFKEQPPERKKR
jgi:hypothetical protein